MNQDPILQNFALIVIFLELVQASLLLFLNNFYKSLKLNKISYEGNIIRDPALKQDLSNQKSLFIRVVVSAAIIIAASIFLQYMLGDSDASKFNISSIKFAFGVISFSTINNILSSLILWFQAKHFSDKDAISGALTFSKNYILKLNAFKFFCEFLAVGFFAIITRNPYLIGGATIFLIFSLRDLNTYKKMAKEKISGHS